MGSNMLDLILSYMYKMSKVRGEFVHVRTYNKYEHHLLGNYINNSR